MGVRREVLHVDAIGRVGAIPHGDGVAHTWPRVPPMASAALPAMPRAMMAMVMIFAMFMIPSLCRDPLSIRLPAQARSPMARL